MDQQSTMTSHASSAASDASTPLRQFLSELVKQGDAEKLLGTIRLYVRTAGLGTGQEVREIALEIFQEMIVEALAHEHRFDTTQPSRAWLLGIANNLVKRHRDEVRKRNQREPLLRDYVPAADELNDDQLFDLVAPVGVPGPEQTVITREQITTMLSLVSKEDREVIELAVLLGMDGSALAARLNVKPNAARVRLHRALGRLRKAWEQHCYQQREGQRDE